MLKDCPASKLYLIGFMGSGKSTVGKRVASLLQWPFLDLDDLIVEREGMEIERIFALKGETYFRDVESQVLKGLSQKKAVVATGGGIVERRENVDYLKSTGFVVFLRMSFDLFLKRLESLKEGRPLLAQDIEDVRKRFELRQPLYESACHCVVDVDGKDVETVAEEVLNCFSQRRRLG